MLIPGISDPVHNCAPHYQHAFLCPLVTFVVATARSAPLRQRRSWLHFKSRPFPYRCYNLFPGSGVGSPEKPWSDERAMVSEHGHGGQTQEK
ncbi:MAG TPA: hypothetical protein VGF67_08965 [Ktedonobacteraceae bacterium]